MPSPLPPGIRPSMYLGVLGMPGMTAYYGLMEICQPKKGDVVLVSSCTGAVGAVVGQIAKLKGCFTVGITSAGKEARAREIGYDAVVSYTGRSEGELAKAIKAAMAPRRGVNCYFDNAGGVSTEAGMRCLAFRARVAVCGQIAYYNLPDRLSARAYPFTMVALERAARIEGFLVPQLPRASPGDWSGARRELQAWIQQGVLRVDEDVAHGLEGAFSEFMTLFHDGTPRGGDGIGGPRRSNLGKKVVEIAAPPLQLQAETSTVSKL